MKKRLLPTDWYHARLRQAYIEDNTLHHCWTIDAGEYKWRNIIREYPLDKVGLSQLEHDMDSLDYEYMSREIAGELFDTQFVGLRANLHVSMKVEGRMKVNEILEFSLPDQPPEVNVLREKSDEHFYQNKQERKLPL